LQTSIAPSATGVINKTITKINPEYQLIIFLTIKKLDLPIRNLHAQSNPLQNTSPNTPATSQFCDTMTMTKVFSFFLLVAILFNGAQAGAFARRSPSTKTEATAVPSTKPAVLQVSLSVLPQVPAFVGETQSRSEPKAQVVRRTVKAESTFGYRLEASLFAQDAPEAVEKDRK
jgi:hypothetical protein